MDYRLTGTFTLLSPLSHIGESISATSYLVQEPIIQADGSVEEVFVYSGNAWRGQLRDLAASYMLDHLGAPQLPLEAFHLLFAGGRIGGEQSVNIDQARRYRRAIPMVAVWGGGIGNQILPGKLRVRNSYPLVAEALPVLPAQHRERASRTPYSAVTFEKSFSRMDDAKDDRHEGRLIAAPAAPAQIGMLGGEGPASKREPKGPPPEQMRMTVELVAPGTVLATGMDLLDVSEIELGCVVSALHRFARSPHIGGQANRGHGEVELEYDIVDLDAGTVEHFVEVVGGRALLSRPAEAAKQAYDDYVEGLYRAYLEERGSEVTALLGAKAAS